MNARRETSTPPVVDVTTVQTGRTAMRPRVIRVAKLDESAAPSGFRKHPEDRWIGRLEIIIEGAALVSNLTRQEARIIAHALLRAAGDEQSVDVEPLEPPPAARRRPADKPYAFLPGIPHARKRTAP